MSQQGNQVKVKAFCGIPAEYHEIGHANINVYVYR